MKQKIPKVSGKTILCDYGIISRKTVSCDFKVLSDGLIFSASSICSLIFQAHHKVMQTP